MIQSGSGTDPIDRFFIVLLNYDQIGGPVLKRVWGGGGRGIPLRGWYVVSRNSSEYVDLKNASQVDESKVGEPDVVSGNTVLAKRWWSALNAFWFVNIWFVCLIFSSCLRIRFKDRMMFLRI